jgi:hypothetical protein
MSVSSYSAPAVPSPAVTGPFSVVTTSATAPAAVIRSIRRESALIAVAVATAIWLMIYPTATSSRNQLDFVLIMAFAPAFVVGVLGHRLALGVVDGGSILALLGMAFGAIYGTLAICALASTIVSRDPGTLGLFIVAALFGTIIGLVVTLVPALIWFGALFIEYRSGNGRVASGIHWLAALIVMIGAAVAAGTLATGDWQHVWSAFMHSN